MTVFGVLANIKFIKDSKVEFKIIYLPAKEVFKNFVVVTEAQLVFSILMFPPGIYFFPSMI